MEDVIPAYAGMTRARERLNSLSLQGERVRERVLERMERANSMERAAWTS